MTDVDMLQSWVFAVRQGPIVPVLIRSLDTAPCYEKSILQSGAPPILKGASPVLHTVGILCRDDRPGQFRLRNGNL